MLGGSSPTARHRERAPILLVLQHPQALRRQDPAAAQRAKQTMDGAWLAGRQLQVTEAQFGQEVCRGELSRQLNPSEPKTMKWDSAQRIYYTTQGKTSAEKHVGHKRPCCSAV